MAKKRGYDVAAFPAGRHIYRCPRCYVKLHYWPTEKDPCACCGYPGQLNQKKEMIEG